MGYIYLELYTKGTISGSSNSICVSTTELDNEKSALINKEIVKSGQVTLTFYYIIVVSFYHLYRFVSLCS